MGGKKKSAEAVARDPLRYLKLRGGKWHYVRRVPAHVNHLDGRGLIQTSLKTSSIDVAQVRRDALERADDLHWQGLRLDGVRDESQARYEAAKARAVALGFEYKGLADLAESGSIEDIIRRVTVARGSSSRDRVAVLGVSKTPTVSVRKAMEFYLEEIAQDEMRGMSASQRESFRKVKLYAADTFIEIVEDKPLLEITRTDAITYHRWWQARVNGADGKKPVSGNTANRRFGGMRKLFREYTRYLQIDVKNPFDDLSFRDPKQMRLKVMPFDADFIEKQFVAKGCLNGLNAQAKLIFLAMVETGARPSEICNLTPAQIHLDAEVPYLQIIYREDRKVKTENSVRDVPLVGVSLEAMKLAPNGFPQYYDRETNLSAALMKHLRTKKLLPSENHRVYSLRHAYEKRMLEAGFDDEFRRRILGHDTDRPDYGDGGSLAWRREQMQKIMLKFDASLFAGVTTVPSREEAARAAVKKKTLAKKSGGR